MDHKLNVFVNRHKAGELWLDTHQRFSFQYDPSWLAFPRHCRLAPFYDLLCTYAYPYAKRMAMKVGGGRHFLYLTPKHFQRFSQDIGVKYRAVSETVTAMAARITGEAKTTTEEFCDLYGPSPVLKEVNGVIMNSAKEKLTLA